MGFFGVIFLCKEGSDRDGEQHGRKQYDTDQAVFFSDIHNGFVLSCEFFPVGFSALGFSQGNPGLFTSEIGNHNGANPEV